MENIIESNRLIAEFMGAGEEYKFQNINARDYHSSWDWLMPVVAKFNEDAPSSLFKTRLMSDFSSLALINEIRPAYRKLVEGIHWYNANKETTK